MIKAGEAGDRTLRVWWQPQVPMKSFYVYVDTIGEAISVVDLLGDYDYFEFDNDVKPDFSNAGGVEMLVGNEWEDWEGMHGDNYFDDLDEYIAYLEGLGENK